MALLAARLPRLAFIGAVLLFASATITWGAAKRLTAVPPAQPAPVVKPTLVVPDVTGQAFVFAKGTLEDAGFAWRVTGGVHGYSANTVVSQSPGAGTKLVDTGAPVVTVTLKRGRYAQAGEPEDVAPYLGTAVVRIDAEPAIKKPAAGPVPAATVGAKKTAAKKPASPVKKAAAPVKKAVAAAKRPPAFAVAGAPKEPLDELPLTERAQNLAAWLGRRPSKTPANVNHFLYQHAWVVTGAKFGWWHGADALRVLVAADRRAQSIWGIGRKSELVAATALAEVEARSH
jgi:hypothetical protein